MAWLSVSKNLLYHKWDLKKKQKDSLYHWETQRICVNLSGYEKEEYA